MQYIPLKSAKDWFVLILSVLIGVTTTSVILFPMSNLEEAIYALAFIDPSGKNLTGGTNYTIHFKPSQIPSIQKDFGPLQCTTAHNAWYQIQ